MTRLVVLQPVRKARRGGKGVPSQAALEALHERMSAIMQGDLLGSFKRIKGSVNYDRMAKAVYSGDYKKVMASIPLKGIPDSLRKGMQAIARSYSEASGIAADKVPIGNLKDDGKDHRSISLRPDNPKVQEYIETRTGELVQNVTDNMQASIQGAIKRGQENRTDPSVIADEIKGSICLDERRANALARYTNNLSDQGYPQSQIEKLSGAYEDRLLDQRAIAIARTETAYAQNAAQMSVWGEAADNGWIPETAGRQWVVDGDPCPICQSLDRQVVGMDEQFEDDDGNSYDGPPAHPNCRCQLALSFDGSGS